MKKTLKKIILLILISSVYALYDYEIILRTKIALAENPMEGDVESTKRGEILFQDNCINCHGKTAMGSGVLAKNLSKPPSDLTKLDQPPGITAMKIYFGSAPMPAWREHFNREQIWQLVSYIDSMQVVTETSE